MGIWAIALIVANWGDHPATAICLAIGAAYLRISMAIENRAQDAL
jgi:hypothetical protein